MSYHYFWPHRGGIENASGVLARELVRMGHRVSYITSNIGVTKSEIRPVHEQISGIDMIRLPAITLPARALALRGFGHALNQIKPDIWHTHHPSPFISDRTMLHAKTVGIPSVLNYDADAADEKLSDKILATGYYILLGYRALEATDVIITHSTSYASTSPWLKNYYKKIKIIPLAIDPSEFKSANGSIIRKRYNLQKAKVICSIGRLVLYRGYEYLVRAMCHLDSDWVLLLGGTGPEEGRLRTLAAELGLTKRIIFAGWVKDEEKKHFLAAADVFSLCSISRGDSFGISALEALEVGIPTIVTDIPGPRDVRGAILVPPRDPSALATAIEGAVGRKVRCDPVFYISNVAKRVMRLYEKIL